MRVPAIMRWPARIRPGRVVSELVSSLDLFPTLVTLTGSRLPPRAMDGQDVSRLVTGEVDRIGGPGIDGGRELVFWARTAPSGFARAATVPPARHLVGQQRRSSTSRPTPPRSRT